MSTMNATQQELDSLGHLEERITRAVELVSALRAEKAGLESQLASAIAERDAFRQELDDLRSERKQVRTRIEKLLGQMDLLAGA
jgi:FtsZ-binding cell division protein ZapB